NGKAGRGGAGAVMGSKNLKAVAIRGTNRVKVADPKAFDLAYKKALAELKASAEIQALTDFGTAASVDYANETGLLPHKNYLNGTFAKSSEL
ncbi:MAG: aldehyde ferredoxin oxidoreductase, partial [Desulfamplus sp.]|nr:aldehyde ferredoxin oxidoreductase [Desulfamplus sp.]